MRNFAFRTAFIYCLIGVAWIFLSDQILDKVISLPDRPFVGTAKGILFVLVNSVVLYFLIDNYLRRLRMNETQYRALFRSHPQSLWVYDKATLKYLAVNNKTIEKYGYTPDQFLHMNMTDVIPDKDDLIEKYTAAFKQQDTLNDVPFLQKDKNGNEFYVRISSYAVVFNDKQACMVMAVDAQAEKTAERKLNITESKLNSLLNNSDDAIWMFDENGDIITYNKAFKEKFSALLGMDVPEVFPIDLKPLRSNPIIDRMMNNFEQVKQGAHLRLEEELFNHQTKKNEYYEIMKTPIYDAENNFIGAGCFAREITERILSQQEIEERVRQLKEIAWIQSHTVRRPLANIMGLVELIKMNSSDRNQIEEAVNMLEVSCKDLDDIIKEVVRKSGNIK